MGRGSDIHILKVEQDHGGSQLFRKSINGLVERCVVRLLRRRDTLHGCCLFLITGKSIEDGASGDPAQGVAVGVDADPCQPRPKRYGRVVLRDAFHGFQPGVLIEVVGVMVVGAEGQAQPIQPPAILPDVLIDHTALHLPSYIHTIGKTVWFTENRNFFNFIVSW